MTRKRTKHNLFGNLGDDGFQMFDGDFYPTPTEVIEKMLEISNVEGKFVLEPSAGRGNIVDYLNMSGAKEVLVCEKQPDLKAILQTKKCKFLKDDFLSVNSVEISHIDMIVMNPPFSKQYDHILHAWEIAPDNCEIISLCNNESWVSTYYSNDEYKEYRTAIKNGEDKTQTRYGKRSKIEDLIGKYGSLTDFGRCFKDAERKTDVSIGCIRLYKPAADKDMEFDNYFSLEEDFEPENYEADIVTYDFVKDAVNTYVGACKLFESTMAANKKINDLCNHFGGWNTIVFGAQKNSSARVGTEKITYETFKKELQKAAWKWIFGKFNMDQYVTTSVMKDLNSFVEKQTQVPFTVKNIYLMVKMVIGTHEERMNRVLVECFDHICSFSSDNRKEGGYKMNSGYKITEKFKIPHLVGHGYSWDDALYVDYPHYFSEYSRSNLDLFEDCIKALCYFNGIKYDVYKHSLWAFFHQDCDGNKDYDKEKCYTTNKWFDFSPFFEIRYFKNQNADLKWKDLKFLERFNQKVAEIKGWALPTQSESTKKEKRNEQARETRQRNKKAEIIAKLPDIKIAREKLENRNVALRKKM